MKPELGPDVERILAVPDEARFWTQSILLLQMRNKEVVTRHEALLRALMLDVTRPYAIREAAADALAGYGALKEWDKLVHQLVQDTDRYSLRLALTIMRNPHVGLRLSDAEFAETVYAYSGLTPRFSGKSRNRHRRPLSLRATQRNRR